MTAEQDQPLDRAAPQPTTAEQEGGDVAALQSALEAAEARARESKDLYLRALAELENVRKRSARDVEQAHKFAVDRFANDLISVKDTLELGLSSAADAETLRSGTQATLKLLAKAFENAGLVEIVPDGEMFNPELHEAVVTQPSPEHVPNSVLQMIQKGYQLNGRLLRPARVIVAREP
jgi:molecular chaperone GrpE